SGDSASHLQQKADTVLLPEKELKKNDHYSTLTCGSDLTA
ncbi:hypothetical protein DBR06_SOUSAS3310127, partial [Sousa chinensis]